ncbi:MAG TPA: metallophosphoesterase [Thermoguttaceae bacterium]|nr:metallophosphoesterase [Thermoguttaceae bacterium]
MVASIEYIEKVIATFGQAAEGNRSTPGLVGNVVELTSESASDVMVTGDLHGNRRNFNLIKKKAGLETHPRRHLVLQEVCHGGPTYPQNGGCMSHAVLEDVAKLKAAFSDRVHFILGNHELAELADYPIQKNKQMLNLLFRLGMQQMYGPATDKVREAFFPFLRSCPLAVRLPHGVFISHSIPEGVDTKEFDKTIFDRPLGDEEYLERGNLFRLVWGRDYRLENAQAFAKMVDARILINGHEPCPEGFNAPNDMQLILDCCTREPNYVILPTDQELSHAEILERVKKLV